MATTMTRIAEEAKVSVSLVSRLLRNDETLKVSATTRQHVLETYERLGGVQSLSLAQKKSKNRHIAVPINREKAQNEIQPMANSPMGRSFERHLQNSGGQMSVVFFDQENRAEAIEKLINDNDYCNGLLIGPGVINTEIQNLLIKHKFPHIFFDSYANRFQVNTLYADQQGGIRQAIDYLTKLGHKRIGHIGPTKNSRYPLFYSILMEADLDMDKQPVCEVDLPRELWLNHALWQQKAKEKFIHWINTEKDISCSALYCHNDSIALGVIDAMRELGIEPGKDLSIVGYDDIESRDPDITKVPFLTTIDNPLEDVGQRAAERLIAQVEEKENNTIHERIPEKLIVRETTGPPKAAKEPPAQSRLVGKRSKRSNDPQLYKPSRCIGIGNGHKNFKNMF